ncbi:hypothetical protein ACFX2J_007397 [Malus domestica]
MLPKRSSSTLWDVHPPEWCLVPFILIKVRLSAIFPSESLVNGPFSVSILQFYFVILKVHKGCQECFWGKHKA